MTFLEMSKPGGPNAWQHWQLTITILKKYLKKIPCSIYIYNISLQLRVFKVQSQLKKAEAL